MDIKLEVDNSDEISEFTFERNSACNLCGIDTITSDSKISHAIKHLQAKEENTVSSLTETYHLCYPGQIINNGSPHKEFICCCGKEFRRKCSLRQHENTVHLKLNSVLDEISSTPIERKEKPTKNGKQTESDHLCGICKKTFTTLYGKKTHEIAVHLKLKPFPCSFCKKGFSIPCNRDAHEKAMHSTSVFICRICQKTFGHESNRNKHENSVHLEIKRHSCETCGRTFAKNQHRLRHEKTHLKLKHFQCSICEKTFSRDSSRNEHENIVHSDEKPFQCELCKLKFKGERERNIHQKAATCQKYKLKKIQIAKKLPKRTKATQKK